MGVRDKLTAITTHFHHWAIPEKIKMEEGFEDMEFPGILKKEQAEVPRSSGSQKISCEISMGLGF